jgi:signal transduction histidine kinase
VIAGLLARLTPTVWLRAPRATARLRLTLLYGALFLLSGTVLLAVTYVLAAHATDITVPGPKGASFGYVPSKSTVPPRGASATGSHVVHLTPAQGGQLQTEATHLHDVAMHRLLIGSGLTLAAMAVISIALGWLMAGRVLAPVRAINAAARRISASNLHERLSHAGPDDEFAELATTLDDLLERLEVSFDAQRHFVANASHELRTPLTLDHALLERALRNQDPTDAFWRNTCERLLASSQQQHRLIDALLTLARSEAALERSESCELSEIVDRVLLSPELDTNNTGLQMHTDFDLAPVTGDPRLLETLVRNLIDNAIRHNTPGGQVEVSTERRAGHPVLTVTNTGPLIPAREIERLLRPFQRAGIGRTIQSDGSGLGLSIVLAIATAHNANLTLNPRQEGGLRIEVRFPVQPHVIPTTPGVVYRSRVGDAAAAAKASSGQ